MHVPGLVVFAVTYALLSARSVPWLRLDRTGAAVVGAVAAVLVGALQPADALRAVDGGTLLLLFSVMGMGAFLAADDLFGALETRWLALARTPNALLGAVVWGSGLLSALVTNDAVCVLGAPLLVRVVERRRLPAAPYLLALATSANTGSVATLVGNPQNMLCGLLGELSYAEHLRLLGPVALLALAINHAVLWLSFRRELAASTTHATAPEELPPPAALPSSAWLTLTILGLTVVAYGLGSDLAWTAAAGFAALLILKRYPTREVWARIDWSLLAFFAALFVVIEGFVRTGAPERLFSAFPLWEPSTALAGSDLAGAGFTDAGFTDAGVADAGFTGTAELTGAGLAAPDGVGAAVAGANVLGADVLGAVAREGWYRLAAIFLVGSNLVSNVPFILVVRDQMATLPDPRLGWELLAMASTFAGNLTLLGSVANLIVAEAGRDVGGLGFFQYLRVGAPVALLTTCVGTLWLVLLAG